MRSLTAFVVLAGLAAVLTGCSTEDRRQADARVAVQEAVAPLAGYTGEVHCTGSPKPWFVPQQTSLFVCVARRDDRRCDWFRATLGNAGWAVGMQRRDGGCVVPA